MLLAVIVGIFIGATVLLGLRLCGIVAQIVCWPDRYARHQSEQACGPDDGTYNLEAYDVAATSFRTA